MHSPFFLSLSPFSHTPSLVSHSHPFLTLSPFALTLSPFALTLAPYSFCITLSLITLSPFLSRIHRSRPAPLYMNPLYGTSL